MHPAYCRCEDTRRIKGTPDTSPIPHISHTSLLVHITPHTYCRCDIIEDIRRINDLAMKAAPSKTGIIVLGGGKQACKLTKEVVRDSNCNGSAAQV